MIRTVPASAAGEGIKSMFVSAGGHETHYLSAGSTGRPLILVHGGGAGADAEGNWSNVIPRLAGRYDIYAPDMVGFGRSAKPRDDGYEYSQPERELHLTAFLDALKLGPAILVGNSMGGLTCLGIARDRPDLVSHLVLMGSAGIAMPLSPQLKTILHYDFTLQGMERIVRALTAPNFRIPPGMVEYRYSITATEDAKHAYKKITAWMNARGGLQIPEERIAGVDKPTLVVAGKNDLVVPITSAYKFLELIPQSWGMILPDCGHWPMIEHPEVFAEIVDQFVCRLSAGARAA
ncbi:MAG: alpha/beta hydrolase [Rhodospirillaceae bacterium]|nr:alpha/beta hydrolase [Rhodospirillaceae bacterium]